jgi:hypothetical protein
MCLATLALVVIAVVLVCRVWWEWRTRRGVLSLYGQLAGIRQLAIKNVGRTPVVIDSVVLDGVEYDEGLRGVFFAFLRAAGYAPPPSGVRSAYGFDDASLLGPRDELVLFSLGDSSAFASFDECFGGRRVTVTYHQEALGRQFGTEAVTMTMRMPSSKKK